MAYCTNPAKFKIADTTNGGDLLLGRESRHLMSIDCTLLCYLDCIFVPRWWYGRDAFPDIISYDRHISTRVCVRGGGGGGGLHTCVRAQLTSLLTGAYVKMGACLPHSHPHSLTPPPSVRPSLCLSACLSVCLSARLFDMSIHWSRHSLTDRTTHFVVVVVVDAVIFS